MEAIQPSSGSKCTTATALSWAFFHLSRAPETVLPHLDATALVALEAVLSDLRQGGRSVVLVGAGPQPLRLLKRAGLLEGDSAVQSVGTIDEALSRVGRRDPPRLIK